MADRDVTNQIRFMLKTSFAWSDDKVEAWFSKPCLILGECVWGGKWETNQDIIDIGRGEELLQLIYECLGNGNY